MSSANCCAGPCAAGRAVEGEPVDGEAFVADAALHRSAGRLHLERWQRAAGRWATGLVGHPDADGRSAETRSAICRRTTLASMASNSAVTYCSGRGLSGGLVAAPPGPGANAPEFVLVVAAVRAVEVGGLVGVLVLRNDDLEHVVRLGAAGTASARARLRRPGQRSLPAWKESRSRRCMCTPSGRRSFPVASGHAWTVGPLTDSSHPS